MTQEVLKQALEALEDFVDVIKYENEQDDIGRRACCDVLSYNPHSESCKAIKSIASLRQAIKELESQEPEAWADLQKEAQQIVKSKVLWEKFIDGTPLANDIACWMADFALQHTHPPQRTWVGLTDYEIGVCSTEAAMNRSEMVGGAVTFARAIEAKLKEKNT